MSSRKTLKSVSVEGLKPTITLTPVIEPCGEGCRIHHIKSDSIARDGMDTFVPLRHVSKQKRRIFELEEENAKLREENKRMRTVAVRYYTELLHSDDVLGQIMARKKLQELGIEVEDDA